LFSGAASYFQLLREKENDEGIASGQRREKSSPSQWQNSIAVLPFRNISPDPEQQYFCDGITEQIITNLSQLQNLKVIARTSVMKFKNSEKTIPEIGEELHVAHILEGSIRKDGNHIRVTAQLIQADGGYQLWAKDYDRELKNIFAVQDDVSEAIARALLKKLTIKEAEELKTKGTTNVEAYEYYLKGEYFHITKFFAARRMEDFRKSENMFKKAIELDPNYALAFAGLADVYNSYYNIAAKNEEEEKKYLDMQQDYIERAFGLDPNSARVNRAKGYVHVAKGEMDKAYESKKRTLEINPNEAANNYAMGVFLATHGLYHQAINFLTKAIVLDPLEPLSYAIRGEAHRSIGNFDQGIIDYKKALEIDSDYLLALRYLARLLIMLKNYNEAEEHLAKSEKINPVQRRNKFIRALLYAVKGKKGKAFESLEAGGFHYNRYNKVVVYSLLGLKDEAIKSIENKPIDNYLEMINNPFFDILRETDEFKAVLQKAKELYEGNLIKYRDISR